MLTRRRFLEAGAATVLAPGALALLAAPVRAAAAFRDGRFAEGVMSGDPGARGITLWTRLRDVERSGTVRLEVARDPGFDRLVAHAAVRTGPGADGAVKARVLGLDPYEQYFYRFETRTTHSAVGRFRTAPPAGSRQPLRFAFWACQDFTHGYYNAHAAMLREDLDFALCLGDYIYAETGHSVAGGTGVRDDGIGSPGYGRVTAMATTLEDYRAKYALYRSDATLRALHQRVPLVAIWDDHEVQNDYAGGVSTGGLPPEHAYSVARRSAAYRAWTESMPTVTRGAAGRRVYRRLRFGRLVDLFLLDVRQYRNDQPCGDRVRPACAGLDRPRALLGRRQMTWLKSGLVGSDAAWKAVAGGVTMMDTRLAGDAYLRFDSWQGYPGEREELLRHVARRRIDDVVFLSGDLHAFVAGDVWPAGSARGVAPEFVCGSVTSSNPGETTVRLGDGVGAPGDDAAPRTDPAVIAALRDLNPWIEGMDLDHHGFGVVRASSRRLDISFRRVETIKQRSAATLSEGSLRWRVLRGQRSLVTSTR